ncbi:MAG: hypothetical protein VX000_01195, partial [Myxococcota bacterium]|nr:hypothetical protein [Myxococcota bacterium]
VTAPAYRATPSAAVTPARLWIPGPLSAGELSIPDGLDAPGDLILDELAAADSGIPAGDLDGDGRDDLGMAWGDPWSVTAEAWLISGASDAQPVAITADRGVSLSALGDIDGDGLADIAVGTPRDSSWYGEMPGASNGGVHLLFGDAALFDSSGSIQAADGVSVLGESNVTTHEQWIPGEAGSVTSLDHDGDGVRDLLMGAPNTGFHSAGTLAVMAGPHVAADPDRVFTDAADVLWVGTTAGAGMGGSVAAGDLNDDGYDDAVSGERTAGGLTYVFHGSASAAGAHDAWTRRDVLLTGSEDGGEGFLGASRSIADIDEDGIPDLILLDERSPYGGASGAFGFRELSESATLGHEDAAMHLLGQGSTAGCAAGPLGLGDMNADGVQDIVLSCISEPPGGQVHVFFGLMD